MKLVPHIGVLVCKGLPQMSRIGLQKLEDERGLGLACLFDCVCKQCFGNRIGFHVFRFAWDVKASIVEIRIGIEDLG